MSKFALTCVRYGMHFLLSKVTMITKKMIYSISLIHLLRLRATVVVCYQMSAVVWRRCKWRLVPFVTHYNSKKVHQTMDLWNVLLHFVDFLLNWTVVSHCYDAITSCGPHFRVYRSKLVKTTANNASLIIYASDRRSNLKTTLCSTKQAQILHWIYLWVTWHLRWLFQSRHMPLGLKKCYQTLHRV